MLQTVVLEKTLEIPLDSKEPNQSILKEINPECSLEGLMLKLQYLATWCKETTRWERPWLWERLRARGEGGYTGWDGWMASLTQWTWVCANSRRYWRTGNTGMLQSVRWQRVGCDLATEQQLGRFHYDLRMLSGMFIYAATIFKLHRRLLNLPVSWISFLLIWNHSNCKFTPVTIYLLERASGGSHKLAMFFFLYYWVLNVIHPCARNQ